MRNPHARRWTPSPFAGTGRNAAGIASVFDQAGPGYLAYADGDPDRLFAFDGAHAYADRLVWSVLDARLTGLRASGAQSVSFLDLGCGPGTWLRRLVFRAIELDFARITARGVDIAAEQVRRARRMAASLAKLPGVDLRFDVADITGRLPEADASVDLTLCLYSVLTHLPTAGLPAVADEIARVTSGHFIATVRPVGSTPTAFVEPMDKVVRLAHDEATDRCEIDLCDGRAIVCDAHLFTAAELRAYFAGRFDIEELRGIDLFHTRFAPDPRWNPRSLKASGAMDEELTRLEEEHAHMPEFMDRAAHLLLVARARPRTG
jgi:SAM-dependent methyltransferase